MSDDRPPVTDAEYRLVRGPWPRWAYQASLWSLALWTAAVVVGCMALGATVYFLVT